ncbi:MAG: O-acetyl-ADP-ribose deacetylase [Aggregatilineales bacterium]
MQTDFHTKVKVRQTTIELIVGDITKQAVDAIVNAANSSLLGGGGVDGAIHRAAGPELLKETRDIGGCKTGDAKISGGYRLPAKYVIHAVGPIYRADDSHVEALLASAYQRSLELAAKHALETIAMPAISTGIYGYPVEKAAPIALQTAIDFATHKTTSIKLVRFVLFTEEIFIKFHQSLKRFQS